MQYHHIVFRASCAVYGVPRVVPISEGQSVRAVNSLRRTENADLRAHAADCAAANQRWTFHALPYFNGPAPNPEGQIGE